MSAAVSSPAPDDRLLPSERDVWASLEAMVRLGPRLAGSAAHRRYTALLREGFGRCGAAVEALAYEARVWDPIRAEVRIGTGASAASVEIASCYPDSGSTSSDGVRGRLVNVGALPDRATLPGDVSGAVVVVEYPIEQQLIGARWNVAAPWGTFDPHSVPMPERFGIGHKHWVALEELRRQVAHRGGLALLVAPTGQGDDFVRGQHQPVFPPTGVRKWQRDPFAWNTRAGGMADLPALWVVPSAWARLVAAATEGRDATVTLVADVTERAPTETLIATLPGCSDETILVVTHSDGMNGVQENGGVALLALAEAFSKLPLEQRGFGLTLVAATGHLCRSVADPRTGRPVMAEGFGVLEAFPALARRAVAAVSIEHLGCAGEWAFASTAVERLAQAFLASLEGTAAGPVCVADGVHLGIATDFDAAGVPTLSYGAMPTWLHIWDETGQIGGLSPRRLHQEVLVIWRLLRRLDRSATV